MIFLRSQALDNLSEDLCVLDGELMSASDPSAASAIALLSAIMRRGRTRVEGSTRITKGRDAIAINVATGERDVGGRPAPVIAVIDRSLLDDIEGIAETISVYARMIKRSVNSALLATDLHRWRSRGKSRGGRSSTTGRLLAKIAMQFLVAFKWIAKRIWQALKWMAGRLWHLLGWATKRLSMLLEKLREMAARKS